MRLSRLMVSSAVIPMVLLAGCGPDESAAKSATPTQAPTPSQAPTLTAVPFSDPHALDAVTVASTAKGPTATLKTTPLNLRETTTRVVSKGKGAALVKENIVRFNYVLFNGKDGKQVSSSFGQKIEGVDLSSAKLMPGLSKGLIGQHLGSRLLVAIPPAEAFGPNGNAKDGFSPTDNVLFLIDLISATAPLKAATGAAVPPKAGLPTATVDGAKPAKITVPKTAPPTTLVVQPLIKGAGAVVQSGQTLKINYTGVLWKDGKKFDASGDHGKYFETPIGVGQVIPAWDKALVGQRVGSRLLLVVPPADGYGAQGSPPKIGPKDTLVFVVDILSAN